MKIINYTVRPNHSKAWEPKFLAPFVIVRISTIKGDEITYKISDGVELRVVHFNRLEKIYVRDDVPVKLSKFTIYEKEPINNLLRQLPIETIEQLSSFPCYNFDKSLSRKIGTKKVSQMDIISENPPIIPDDVSQPRKMNSQTKTSILHPNS